MMLLQLFTRIPSLSKRQIKVQGAVWLTEADSADYSDFFWWLLG